MCVYVYIHLFTSEMYIIYMRIILRIALYLCIITEIRKVKNNWFSTKKEYKIENILIKIFSVDLKIEYNNMYKLFIK